MDPTPAHWESLRLTLYQHMLWSSSSQDWGLDLGLDLGRDWSDVVFSADRLHPFANLIVSAPFFHPTPLVCMKQHSAAAVLLHKCVPNRCQLRSRKCVCVCV